MLNTELNYSYPDQVIVKQFDLFRQLKQKGWRIELEQIDQLENGYWHEDPITKLPYPAPDVNADASISLVTWTTYVYPPKAEDYLLKLNASFNSPFEAYNWLEKKLKQHAK